MANGNDLSREILATIRTALAEDIGPGDATTNSIVPAEATMRGQIIAKQDGVIAGLDVAQAVYQMVDAQVDFRPQVEEGARVTNRQVLALVSGRTRSLLTAERTALNFLGRMSGIATLTRAFVDAVAGTKAVILDTRKTAPGLRLVDKLAVRRGGGQNHRIGLYDMVLIKDNHIDYRRVHHHRGDTRPRWRGRDWRSKWKPARWTMCAKPWAAAWNASCSTT